MNNESIFPNTSQTKNRPILVCTVYRSGSPKQMNFSDMFFNPFQLKFNPYINFYIGELTQNLKREGQGGSWRGGFKNGEQFLFGGDQVNHD